MSSLGTRAVVHEAGGAVAGDGGGLPLSAKPLDPGDPTAIARYEIVALLGRGAMGAVYLGRDGDRGWVAVKTIRPDLDHDEQYRARFVNEVRNASRVRSPFVPSVLDYGEDENRRAYLVTEFIDGRTLEETLDRRPLDPNGLFQLAVNVLHAIIALHDTGIIHRDIKPQNIIMSDTGPRVIDLGVSRALADEIGLTSIGRQPGTAATMAPEQWLGGRRTTASDVFAWGCVVVRAGTGRYPFTAEDHRPLKDAVLNDEPNLGGLEPPLRPLVAQALRKNPAHRPSASDALGRLLTTTRTEAAARQLASPATPAPQVTPAASVGLTTSAPMAPDHGPLRAAGSVQPAAWPDSAPVTPDSASMPPASGSGSPVPNSAPSTTRSAGGQVSAGHSPPVSRRLPDPLPRRWLVLLSAAVALAAFGALAGVTWLGITTIRSGTSPGTDVLASQPLQDAGSQPLAPPPGPGRLGPPPPGQPPLGPPPDPVMVDAARRVIAEANRVRRRDPALARRLDLAAFRLVPLPEVRAALMRYGFPAGTLAGPVGPTSAVAVNVDAATVVAGAGEGTAVVWDRSDLQDTPNSQDPQNRHNPQRRVLDVPEGGVGSVALSPDGTTLATGGRGYVRLFDTRDAARSRVLATGGSGGTSGIPSLVFGPGGDMLAVAGLANDVRIYPNVNMYLAGGSSAPRRLPHPDSVLSVTFSRDGRTLATGGRDGVIRLWTVADAADIAGMPDAAGPRVVGEGAPVTSLATSPFDDSLVSGHEDGSARLWNLVHGGSVQLLGGQGSAVTSADFGESPEIIVTGSRDGTVRLWHLADAGMSITLQRSDRRGGGGVTFSGDGRTLVAGSAGGGVRLWNLDPIDIADHVCGAGGADLSTEEWDRHVNGVGFRPSCP